MFGFGARALGVIGGGLCLLAGAYLLNTQAVADDSYLETIAHGMGLYFLGKGVFILAATAYAEHLLRHARRLEPTTDTTADP